MNFKLITLMLITVVSLSSFKGKDKDAKANKSDVKQTISGSIVDEVSGETLVGVEVMLDGTNIKTYTDFDGNFTFNNVTTGNHTISAKLISYSDVDNKEIKVKTDSNQNLKIVMSQVN